MAYKAINTTWTGRLVLVAVALGLWITVEPVPGEPTKEPAAATHGSRKSPYPNVPQDVLDAYINGVKQTRLYKMARLLPLKTVKAAAKDWEKTAGLELRVNPQLRGEAPSTEPTESGEPSGTFSPMIWSLLSMPGIPLPDGRYGFLVQAGGVGPSLIAAPERGLRLIVHPKSQRGEEWSGGPGSHEYALEPEQLAELDFPYANTIEIVDPLSATIEHFVTRGETLGATLQRLCAAGKVTCSFRQDLVDRATITADLRDKTILTCLKVVAAAAGGRILFMHPDGQMTAQISLNNYVELDQVIEKTRDTPTTQEEALQILKKAVMTQARSMLNNRPILILQVPATDAKE